MTLRMPIEGKVVVVTGSGRGLGRAYARELARNGARVIINDVNADAAGSVAGEIAAEGGEAVVHSGSVTEWSSAGGLIDTAVRSFGRVDGLVNNAAIMYQAQPGAEEEQRLRAIVEVNVLGSAFVAEHAFRAMKRQGFGTILNVSSGAHLGMDDLTAYGMTKGAVASLTYGMALVSAAFGINVNALCPLAETDMGAEYRVPGTTHPGLKPENVAPVVVYLMSDRAKHLNGQVVRYDGRSLNLLATPNFRTVSVTDGVDDLDGIAVAFESTLFGQQCPVGLVANL